MGYCEIDDVDFVMAQSQTSGSNPAGQQKRKLLLIGKQRDKNVIPDEIVIQYIQTSGQEIDAILSSLYKTPLREFCDVSTKLYSDIGDYNNYIVLEKVCPLTIGDNVIITDGVVEERHQISEAIGNTVFSTLEPISYAFLAGSRVLRIKFPDPIPFICMRLAAANLYDKYFSAQASPNVSEYGKFLREQARQKINDILNGRTILHGVHRIGRRLYDPTISDQYGLPMGNDPNRDIDKLS